jgi:3-methyl-2-oxobutanoate hydroxymethyltransferase
MSRRRLTVADLAALKGKRQLTMLRFFTLEEAAAAEAAGIDVASVPPELAADPEYRRVAPSIFTMTGHTHLTAGTREDYLRWAGNAIEHGADAVYCSGSMETVEYLAREYIPVVGHVGLVPARAGWTGGYRAVGKTAEGALKLYEECLAYERAGAIAVELEVVPVEVASEISRRLERLSVWSMGSGAGCDAQYLFAMDILGENTGHVPRHAKVYRDFAAEHARLQRERIAAFMEFRADVESGGFPEDRYLVRMDAGELATFRALLPESEAQAGTDEFEVAIAPSIEDEIAPETEIEADAEDVIETGADSDAETQAPVALDVEAEDIAIEAGDLTIEDVIIASEPQTIGLRVAAQGISFGFDPHCGFIRDFTVEDEGHAVAPLHRAPWVGTETLPEETEPHLAGLEGDFFCAPFADGRGKAPILHGWPANSDWRVNERAGESEITAVLERNVEGARLTKRLVLRDGHPFVYQCHTFEGGVGVISTANHAMVSLPVGGRLSFSPKAYFATPNEAPEPDAERGRSALRYPGYARTPLAFPLANGQNADLTRYPFVHQHEDFVVGIEDPSSTLGWTAVVRLGYGELFISLRDPRRLPWTMLWHSDGGRDYAPWSGRHLGCLGVEEGNAPHMLGQPGGLTLGGKLEIRHAIGAIAWPSEAPVASIAPGDDTLTIRGEDGTTRTVPFDISQIMS